MEALKNQVPIEYPPEEGFTKLAVDLLSRMLMYSVVHRFSAKQVIKHPWITRSQESRIPKTTHDLLIDLECQDLL